MSLYVHVPHPHIEHRKQAGPARTDTVRGTSLNDRIGLGITLGVGTMKCAYAFAVLALLSLPSVLSAFGPFSHTFPAWMVKASIIALVAWIAQTFFQLVLLPIIIVGQNIQARAADARADQTYKDAEAVLHEALQIQAHLAAQDDVLTAVRTGHADLTVEQKATREDVHALVTTLSALLRQPQPAPAAPAASPAPAGGPGTAGSKGMGSRTPATKPRSE